MDGSLQNHDGAGSGPLAGKRLLVVCSLFPPDILGGAEMSASNLTHWLKDNAGVEIGVLTTAKAREEACDGVDENGLKIWRVWMPRPYPIYRFPKAPQWQKPIWHLQDHFDPRNRTIVARVLDDFKPDYINIHVLQGIGYNALNAIADRRIPTLFFLHDLGLACIRMSMFKNGRDCAGRCALCAVSSAYKRSLARRLSHLAFCSPSRANLERLAQYFPVKNWPNTAILNANKYPRASAARTESDHLRILYVGRLHVSKGIHLLLQVAADLAKTHRFTLTIVGTGPDEERLRREYGTQPWCHFTGFVDQAAISNFIVGSDVMCIPSIWAENSPGVVIHALGLGLPVIGSDRGGIPELIENGKNGCLFRADDAAALRAALERIFQEPALLENWSSYALSNAYKFDQDHLGRRILEFIGTINHAEKTRA